MRSSLLSTLMIGLFAVSAWSQRDQGVEARPQDLEQMAGRLGSGVAWAVSDPMVLEEGRNREAVREAAKAHADFDRSSAMDAALERARATKRPLLWYIPRITAGMNGRQMYRPAVVDLYARHVFFTDPECVDLLNRRFVPVTLFCDEKLGERFGISAPDRVEPALMILDPEGKPLRLIDSIRSFNASWFDRVLRDLLAAHPELAAPSEALEIARRRGKQGDIDIPDFLEAMLRDGDCSGLLTQVDSILSNETVLDAWSMTRCHLLAARAHRRRDELDQSRAALTRAEATLARAENDRAQGRSLRDLQSVIATEVGRVALLDRRLADARTALETVRVGSSSRDEARYWLGLIDFYEGRESFARRQFRDATSHSDSPWAWKAAANLIDGEDRTPIGPTFHGFEDPFRAPPLALESEDTSVARDVSEAPALAREAVEYLLRMQRSDGSWPDSRYAYWGTYDLTPNVWVSATALACTALLEWRELDPARIDAALSRGEAWAFDDRNISPGANEEIYAQGYRLLYLTRKFDKLDLEDADGKARCLGAMNTVIQRLKDIQKGEDSRGRGNWAHEYPNAFCTAAVMNALALARERGAEVPNAMMIAGAEALLEQRGEDGSYAYAAGRKVDQSPEGRSERLKDSMGRAAICEAAIKWARHPAGETAKVSTAVETFWEYLPRLERIRRCDFHTDGQLGGFFFWHAVFHTTEAIKTLPGKSREANMQRMSEFLTTLGEMDGSFLDSHEIGKSYGTAMGLLSLKNALGDRKP